MSELKLEPRMEVPIKPKPMPPQVGEKRPFDGVEDDFIDQNFKIMKTERTARQKELLTMLRKEFGTKVPMHGFKADVIKKDGSSQRRCKRMCRGLLYAISSILCPDGPEVLLDIFQSCIKKTAADQSKCNEKKLQKKLEKVTANLGVYAMSESKEISNIAQSILASSFNREECNLILRRQAQIQADLSPDTVKTLDQKRGISGGLHGNDDNSDDGGNEIDGNETDAEMISTTDPNFPKYQKLRLRRGRMGRDKFKSMKKAFSDISNGKTYPKANYPCRMDPEKVLVAMAFLEEKLERKPKSYRNVRIGTALYHNLPVYKKGDISMVKLFQIYQNTLLPVKHVGKHTFRDLYTLLTKKEISRAGLSSFYAQY